MSKHYLIRRNLETFLGPMTVEELKNAYQRMDFGLQDEVGGSFGDWVAFDDLEKIETKYPELLPVVKDTMLGGWGFSQNTATRIIDKKPKRGSSKPSHSKKKGGLGLGFVTVIMLCVAAGTAYYLARYSSYGQKFFNISRSSPAGKFEKLLRSGDKSTFINGFQSKLPMILKDARKSKSNLRSWLPSFRAFAYMTKGSIPGVSSKLLKGSGFEKAPKSCSMAYWKKEWEKAGADLESFSKTASNNSRLKNWQRVLLWDPYWISRRSGYSDWVYPKNYFHACVIMAEKGLMAANLNFETEEDRQRILNPIQSRLAQQNQIIESGKSFSFEAAPSEEALGILAIIGCFDESESEEGIDECATQSAQLAKNWQKYIEYRNTMAKIRTGIHSFSMQIEKKQLQELSNHSSVLTRSDVHTGMRYSAESRYIRNLLRNNGNVEASVNELKYHHEHVDVLIGH